MDRKQVRQIKALIKLMHENGITSLKIGDIELTIPHPKPSIRSQIMHASTQEFVAAAQSAMGNHKGVLERLNDKKPAFTSQTEMDELDELLFYHEKAQI